MAVKRNRKVSITLMVPVKLAARIDKLAAALKLSRSEFCSDLMTDALAKDEQVLKAMTDETVQKAFFGAMSDPKVVQALAASISGKVDPDKLASLFSGLAKGSADASAS